MLRWPSTTSSLNSSDTQPPPPVTATDRTTCPPPLPGRAPCQEPPPSPLPRSGPVPLSVLPLVCHWQLKSCPVCGVRTQRAQECLRCGEWLRCWCTEDHPCTPPGPPPKPLPLAAVDYNLLAEMESGAPRPVMPTPKPGPQSMFSPPTPLFPVASAPKSHGDEPPVARDPWQPLHSTWNPATKPCLPRAPDHARRLHTRERPSATQARYGHPPRAWPRRATPVGAQPPSRRRAKCRFPGRLLTPAVPHNPAKLPC